MRILLAVFAALLAVHLVLAKSKTDNNNNNNDEAKGKSYKKAFKECQKHEATRIDGSIIKKLKRHKQVDLPDNFADHKLCLLKGIGFINADDTINEEYLKKKLTKKAKPDQDVNNIVAECKVAKTTAKETALNMDSCLQKYGFDL